MRFMTRLLVTLVFCLSSVSLQAGETDNYLSIYEDSISRLSQGELDAALIQAKNALLENPTHLPSRILLGNIYLLKGQGANAEKELTWRSTHLAIVSWSLAPSSPRWRIASSAESRLTSWARATRALEANKTTPQAKRCVTAFNMHYLRLDAPVLPPLPALWKGRCAPVFRWCLLTSR